MAGDGGLRRDFRAGQLDEQREGAVAGGEQRAGIDAAFVAIGGVGHQAEAAAGAAHGRGKEPRGFEHDLGGRLDHAGRFAAHDAGDGDGSAFVGDDEIVGEQLVGLVVERLELFARACAAHLDDAARELGGVEGVERLAQSRRARSW